jgi:N-terminal acetyltransferase B complex non-catalytic subunit
LSVKQIQYDSVAHILFTRLSTVHPHSAPPVEGAEYKDFDPLSAFVQALNFFRNSEANTMRFRTAGLDEGAYVNTEEIIELRRCLSNSITRRMYALDARRVQRLAGGDPMTRYDELGKFPVMFPVTLVFYLRTDRSHSPGWLASRRFAEVWRFHVL